MTDDLIRRVADVAPELTRQQLARVHELLVDEQPSAEALAGLRRLLEDGPHPRFR